MQSEAYYFKLVNQALNKKDKKEFVRKLFTWFDKVRKPEQTAAIYYYLNSEEKALLESIFQSNDARIGSGQQKKLQALLLKLRTELIELDSQKDGLNQLNPI